MKGKNKYLPVCAAMYANYAAHGFGLIYSLRQRRG